MIKNKNFITSGTREKPNRLKKIKDFHLGFHPPRNNKNGQIVRILKYKVKKENQKLMRQALPLSLVNLKKVFLVFWKQRETFLKRETTSFSKKLKELPEFLLFLIIMNIR